MVKNKKVFYSPLRYPGGKTCIFPFVSDFIYKNNLVGVSYAEPYAGGAGLALRLLIEGYVDSIKINDLDKSIFAFWFSILNHTDKFCKWVDEVDVNIDTWQYCKSIQQDKESQGIFELGKSTFFLNRTNVSGVIKGGVIGGVAQNGKYKIDARFDKKTLIEKIQRVAQMRSKISLSNQDGKDFIKSLNRLKKETLVYIDPPYYIKGSNLYMNYFKDDDHIQLRDAIMALKKYWLISYDFCPFIQKLYASYPQIVYQLSQCTSNRTGNEILIFDKALDYEDSMSLLCNARLDSSFSEI